MTADEETSSRYRGALLGLACGDALGTTLEFKPPGSFVAIKDELQSVARRRQERRLPLARPP